MVICAPSILSGLFPLHGFLQMHIHSSLARVGTVQGHHLEDRPLRQGPGNQGQAGCGLGLGGATE